MGQPRQLHRRPISAPTPCIPNLIYMGGGDAMRDAQAGVPSTGWLWAQLAFKNSMVHGILQFTPSIAFCYVLHRCVSRDIRCRESFLFERGRNSMHTANGAKTRYNLLLFSFSLAHSVPGLVNLSTKHLWRSIRSGTNARRQGTRIKAVARFPIR